MTAVTVLDLALIRHFTVALRRCAVVAWQNLGLNAPSLNIRLLSSQQISPCLKNPLGLSRGEVVGVVRNNTSKRRCVRPCGT